MCVLYTHVYIHINTYVYTYSRPKVRFAYHRTMMHLSLKGPRQQTPKREQLPGVEDDALYRLNLSDWVLSLAPAKQTPLVYSRHHITYSEAEAGRICILGGLPRMGSLNIDPNVL